MCKKYRIPYSQYKKNIFERLDHYDDEHSKEFMNMFDSNFGNLNYKELIDEIKNMEKNNINKR